MVSVLIFWSVYITASTKAEGNIGRAIMRHLLQGEQQNINTAHHNKASLGADSLDKFMVVLCAVALAPNSGTGKYLVHYG
jgi:hypothetical protein